MPAWLAVLALTVAPSSYANSTFAWTGAGGSLTWSTPGNWGGSAPGEGETVDLAFPAAACTPECASTKDDLANLTVGTLSLANKIVLEESQGPGSPPPPGPPRPSSYDISGTTPFTLTEGIDVVTVATGSGTGVRSSPMRIDPPIVLGGANSWSLGSDVGLALTRAITGPYPLDITAHRDTLQMEAHEEVGPLTVTEGWVSIGESNVDGDLNGVDKEPVLLNESSLFGHGSVGPLTLTNGYLYVGFPGFGGDLHVNGALTLSGTTSVEIHPAAPPEATPRIITQGAANLGSATLRIGVQCPTPGTVFTLVEASGGVSGVFTDLTGEPIANGETIQAADNDCPTSSSTLPLRIDYSADAVTATVMASGGSTQSAIEPHEQQNPKTVVVVTPNSTTLSSATMVAAMAREIAPSSKKAAKIATILKHGGLQLPFRALRAGTAIVDWYAMPTGSDGGRKRSKIRPVLIASGRLAFSSQGSADLNVKLTKQGTRLLRHAERLHVIARGTFASVGQPPIISTRTFTLER